MNYCINIMPFSTHAWRILDERELLSKIKIKAYMERINNMKNMQLCVGQIGITLFGKTLFVSNHYASSNLILLN